MAIISVSSGYHSQKFYKISSYLTITTCQFDRYKCKRLPFELALTSNMFQQKIDEILKDLPNVLGNADDILVVGHNANGYDHKKTENE